MIEADLGRPVLLALLKLILPAFTRPSAPGDDEERNIDLTALQLSGFDSYLTDTVSHRFHVGEAVLLAEPEQVEPPAPDVDNEPWVQEFAGKLAEFDVDQDGVLNGQELKNFSLGRGSYNEKDAARVVEFFMKTGPEADPAFLAADGMLLEGLLKFYTNASAGRAIAVRKDLEALGLTHTVPERHGEKPKKKPTLGKATNESPPLCIPAASPDTSSQASSVPSFREQRPAAGSSTPSWPSGTAASPQTSSSTSACPLRGWRPPAGVPSTPRR
jgi:hypothetical protein